jgi:hypothetical protein
MEVAKQTLAAEILLAPQKISVHWYRSVIFKILYTIQALQLKFPYFRHNDLHLENILMVPADTIMPEVYHLPECSMILPVSSHIPCMSDFGWASLTRITHAELKSNLPGLHGFLGVKPLNARDYYGDMYFFLWHLLRFSEEKHITLPPSVIQFIFRVIPVEFREKDKWIGLDKSHPLWSLHRQHNRPGIILHFLKNDVFFQPLKTSHQSVKNYQYNQWWLQN